MDPVLLLKSDNRMWFLLFVNYVDLMILSSLALFDQNHFDQYSASQRPRMVYTVPTFPKMEPLKLNISSTSSRKNELILFVYNCKFKTKM